MTGTDLCVNNCKQSRSYLNHLVPSVLTIFIFNFAIKHIIQSISLISSQKMLTLPALVQASTVFETLPLPNTV